MNTLRNFLVLVLSISFYSVFAQSSAGIKFINYERWQSAEAEFAKSSEDADVFYKGFAQMKQENFEGAKATFNSIADKPYGKIGLGWLELNAGNSEGADKLFEEATDHKKNQTAEIFAAISRAVTHSNSEDKSTAITWGKKASDMAKTNPDYRIVWGDAYLSTLDGGAANNQYEYAQQYAPKSALPYAKIGMVYYRMKVYKESLKNLKKALEIDPNNLLALNYLAQTYYVYRVYDTAEIYQQRLIDLGDKQPEDMAMMANIYFLGKNYDKTISLINEIIEGDNKYNYLNRLIGYSYYETGRNEESVASMEKFLETQPADKIIASDYGYLGKAYIALGDKEKGLGMIRKSIEMDPENKETVKELANSFRKEKMYPEALEFYLKLIEMPDATATDHLNVGIGYYLNKRYEESDAAFTKVLELSPNSADAYYMKAKCKVYMDPEQETASAKEDYQKYIEMTSGNEAQNAQKIVTAKLYLTRVAIKNDNDIEMAKQLLDQIFALDPDNAEALDLMKFVEGGVEE